MARLLGQECGLPADCVRWLCCPLLDTTLFTPKKWPKHYPGLNQPYGPLNIGNHRIQCYLHCIRYIGLYVEQRFAARSVYLLWCAVDAHLPLVYKKPVTFYAAYEQHLNPYYILEHNVICEDSIRLLSSVDLCSVWKSVPASAPLSCLIQQSAPKPRSPRQFWKSVCQHLEEMIPVIKCSLLGNYIGAKAVSVLDARWNIYNADKDHIKNKVVIGMSTLTVNETIMQEFLVASIRHHPEVIPPFDLDNFSVLVVRAANHLVRHAYVTGYTPTSKELMGFRRTPWPTPSEEGPFSQWELFETQFQRVFTHAETHVLDIPVELLDELDFRASSILNWLKIPSEYWPAIKAVPVSKRDFELWRLHGSVPYKKKWAYLIYRFAYSRRRIREHCILNATIEGSDKTLEVLVCARCRCLRRRPIGWTPVTRRKKINLIGIEYQTSEQYCILCFSLLETICLKGCILSTRILPDDPEPIYVSVCNTCGQPKLAFPLSLNCRQCEETKEVPELRKCAMNEDVVRRQDHSRFIVIDGRRRKICHDHYNPLYMQWPLCAAALALAKIRQTRNYKAERQFRFSTAIGSIKRRPRR